MPARSKVFMDIEVEGLGVNRVSFELFDDATPKCAANFRKLCTGELGNKFEDGKPSQKQLTYKGSGFHRIIPGFMAQGGDFTNGNGTGGVSIYGSKFNDENFKIKHTNPYMLSMANAGPNTNGSQFFITFAACPWLDGKHTVFGEVVDGQVFLQKLEKLGSQSGQPSKKVTIKDCGSL